MVRHENHTKLEIFRLLTKIPKNNDTPSAAANACYLLVLVVVVVVGGGGGGVVVAATAAAAAAAEAEAGICCYYCCCGDFDGFCWEVLTILTLCLSICGLWCSSSQLQRSGMSLMSV